MVARLISGTTGRVVTPESDEDKVDVSTTRVGERLRLSFRNKVGPALDVAYIVTPDASKYVDANGRPVEVEIYLDARTDETFTQDPNDPNNLKKVDTAKYNIDNPFINREADAVNFSNPDTGGMS